MKKEEEVVLKNKIGNEFQFVVVSSLIIEGVVIDDIDSTK